MYLIVLCWRWPQVKWQKRCPSHHANPLLHHKLCSALVTGLYASLQIWTTLRWKSQINKHKIQSNLIYKKSVYTLYGLIKFICYYRLLILSVRLIGSMVSFKDKYALIQIHFYPILKLLLFFERFFIQKIRPALIQGFNSVSRIKIRNMKKGKLCNCQE